MYFPFSEFFPEKYKSCTLSPGQEEAPSKQDLPVYSRNMHGFRGSTSSKFGVDKASPVCVFPQYRETSDNEASDSH